jgi:hypothetical protein
MHSEIVVIYNDSLLFQWEEDDPARFNRFWFNEIESADLETDALTEAIKSRYHNFMVNDVPTSN